MQAQKQKQQTWRCCSWMNEPCMPRAMASSRASCNLVLALPLLRASASVHAVQRKPSCSEDLENLVQSLGRSVSLCVHR